MKGQRTLFSKQSGDWRTPKAIFHALNSEFEFTLDPCPTNGISEFNGLIDNWNERCFINPPYSQIGKWIEKAMLEIRASRTKIAVFLIPARTDRPWFHDYCLSMADEIRFIRGRLRFEGAKWNAPFPSMIVIFRASKLT